MCSLATHLPSSATALLLRSLLEADHRVAGRLDVAAADVEVALPRDVAFVAGTPAGTLAICGGGPSVAHAASADANASAAHDLLFIRYLPGTAGEGPAPRV
jgi:hypothetical protein